MPHNGKDQSDRRIGDFPEGLREALTEVLRDVDADVELTSLLDSSEEPESLSAEVNNRDAIPFKTVLQAPVRYHCRMALRRAATE